jgi:hypothetical protein
MIENYKYKYRSRGKFIFVPNERCERRGRRMLKFFSKRVDFPAYFYHYKDGGHVAALHAHIENSLFFSKSTSRISIIRSRECALPAHSAIGATRALAHFRNGHVS